MIKSVSILTRKASMSHADFKRAWLTEHAPLVRSVPEVKKYVLSFVIDQPAEAHEALHQSDVDGIAELWYASEEEMNLAATRPEMRAVLANGALYLDGATTITTEEIDII